MIKTGNPIISIYTETTPNPETLKFVANKLLYPSKSMDIPDVSKAKASPLAQELFVFPFVKSVFIASNFVSITKTTDTSWEDIILTLREFLRAYVEANKPVIIQEYVEEKIETETIGSKQDASVVEKIKELLTNYVQPAVEMDGGAIAFKSYKDGIVTLSMQGSCSGCPSSTITLKAGIENMMKRMIPEVKEVVSED